MPFAALDQVELYYEASGTGEPLVMIHGLGAQMIAWYPGLVVLLQQVGFRTVLFDNRDVGLSSKFDAVPDYTLTDMSSDVVGLLDHLGLDSAHIVGQSMGGMIAQQLAIDHPERVRSLTIVYSTPDLNHIVIDEETHAVRHQPEATDRDDAIRQFIEVEQISGLDGLTDEWIDEFAAAVVDRCYCPDGVRRQEAAIGRTAPPLESLKKVTVPTSVIHGRDDRLISYTGGIAIAHAIAGSELHVYAGMGHQLVPRLWPEFAQVIRRTAERAGAFTDGMTARSPKSTTAQLHRADPDPQPHSPLRW